MGDLFYLAYHAIVGARLRSMLSMLGIAIGIASVVLLTSMGEGTRRFISGEFSQFGTHIIGINPGKTETFGIPGMMGGTTQKLTLDDATALKRVQGVLRVVPLVIGQGRVEGGGRARSVFVYGVTWPGNAATAGLARGDILLKIDGEDVGSIEDVQSLHEKLVADVEAKHRVVLSVMRRGLLRQVVLDYRRDHEKE